MNNPSKLSSELIVQYSFDAQVAGWNYVGLTQASTTDTWVYKKGGSGGTTLLTVVITYTDSTKATISSVAKS